MSHLIYCQIKQKTKSRIIQIMFGLLVIVMVADPITTYIHFVNYPESANRIGQNAYQYWILMNSANWGCSLYYNLFWFFPVLITGLIPYFESRTNLDKLLISRNSRRKYLVSNFVSIFLFSFFYFTILLLINLLVTVSLFPLSAQITEQYIAMQPNPGSFFSYIFSYSPLLLMLFYIFLNSIVIALFSIFSTAIQLLPFFNNIYITLIVPAIIPYLITFFFDAIPSLFPYNILMILQPAASYALEAVISGRNILITFILWACFIGIWVYACHITKKDLL